MHAQVGRMYGYGMVGVGLTADLESSWREQGHHREVDRGGKPFGNGRLMQHWCTNRSQRQ